jgi:hypothetical protein
MDRVLRVDLGDAELVDRLKKSVDSSSPGGIRELGRVLGADGTDGQVLSLPIRLLILDPRSAGNGRRVAESVVARLLEIDPPVRAIVLLVPAGDERAEYLGDRHLPGLYSFPHVKVVDLRGDRITAVRESDVAKNTEYPAADRWADDYRADAQGMLLDRETFDQVWESIDPGKVSALGLRVAGLGAGRERAVADTALRLASEIDPMREPATGSELPDRWQIDKELLPVSLDDVRELAQNEEMNRLPAGVGAIARVRNVFFTSVLRPSPRRYNEVFVAIGKRVVERPPVLAKALEASQNLDEAGEIRINPLGAADLDAELGGKVVYGDSYAEQYAAGRDASFQVEALVRKAVEYIGRGIAAAIPARWLKQDHEAVTPVGPMEAVEYILNREQPWHQAAEKTKADIPQGGWSAGREMKAGFVVAGLMVALSAWLEAGLTSVPLLSYVALFGGIAAAFLLPRSVRFRVEPYLLVWGIVGFTAARFLLDTNTLNPVRVVAQSIGLVPLEAVLGLVVSVLAGLAAVSVAVALIPLERAAESVLPSFITAIIKFVFGNLSRILYFVGAFAFLYFVFAGFTPEVWMISWPRDTMLVQPVRVGLALLSAFIVTRVGPILPLGVGGALWLLNPWSGGATAAPNLPAITLDPIWRFLIAMTPALLLGRTAIAWVGGLSLPKLSDWVANIEVINPSDRPRLNPDHDERERLAPRWIAPDESHSVERACVRAADEGWEKDREWVELAKCGKDSMVRVVEKPKNDPAFDGVVFEDENGNLIADEPEASTPVAEVVADEPVPVEAALAAAEPETEEKKAMAAMPAKKGRKPTVSTDVVPEQTELAPPPEDVIAEEVANVSDEVAKESEESAIEGAEDEQTEEDVSEDEDETEEAPKPTAPKFVRLKWRKAQMYPTGEAWRVPESLSIILGSPVWATRWGAALFLSAAAIVLGLAGAQLVIEFLHWMNIIEEYPIKIGPGGISAEMASAARLIWGLAVAGVLPYLAASYFVAGRMRAWIDKGGYSAAARALARMEAVARLAAIQEVARFAIRREYKRTAAQAASLVEEAAAAGSDTARKFGEALEQGTERPKPLSGRDPIAPHRELVGAERDLPGTDASGIYRVYPKYIATLRRIFAGALDIQVQERFARMRGEFFDETNSLIREGVTIALRYRLNRILQRGLVVGEMKEAGRDVGVEIAEELWSDKRVRDAALAALTVKPTDAISHLLSPGQARMLDEGGTQFVVLPQPLAQSREQLTEAKIGKIIISTGLEAAAVIRVTPFAEGYYDFDDVRGPEEAEKTNAA